MVLKGVTIFLSAFLLFLVQPILAKLIVPRFGGGAAVWATCLVFFQSALLLGYAYAHQLVRRDALRVARVVHIALLLASLALLPIIPAARWHTQAGQVPSLQILALLVATIGLPFTLLATTSPLLQAWTARGHPERNPYRLFAVSNLASLAALVSYPWLVEPWLRTATQARVWSAAYAVYVALTCLICIATPLRGAADEPSDAQRAAQCPPTWPSLLRWTALAALPSYALIAITNHLTQNIPSIPMMWVLPLAIYLLTFALCFDGDRWYSPRLFALATPLAVLAMCAVLYVERLAGSLAWQAGAFLAGLFVVCMYCHGELARSRPSPAQLTRFYLCVSTGGAFGGAVVGLAAPALLPGYFELEIGLVLMAAAVLWRSWGAYRVAPVIASLLLACTVATALYRVDQGLNDVVAMSRNFFGVLRIREYGSEDEPSGFERTLTHGSTLHGEQYLSDSKRRQPTSYYTVTSGIGRLLKALSGREIEVGVVGLGAGTLAAYGKRGDVYRFYEIDPDVVGAARKHFTFIADSQARVEVLIGDGRLLLQAEAPQRYDVLAIDAFTSDSIPIHLLTREAVALYLERVKQDGVIALHVSNRYLDLRPVVGEIAEALGLQLAYVEDPESDSDPDKAASDWILLARHRGVLDLPDIKAGSSALPAVATGRPWTDDYSNIVQVFSFRKAFGAD
jgi:hypothetical protein